MNRFGLMKTILLFLALTCAVALGQTNVTVTWNPNPEINLRGYVVAYGTNGIGFTTNNQIAYLSPLVTTTSLTFTNLPAGPAYAFAVKAIAMSEGGGDDSDWSDEADWRSGKLSRPTGVNRVVSINVNVTISQ